MAHKISIVYSSVCNDPNLQRNFPDENPCCCRVHRLNCYCVSSSGSFIKSYSSPHLFPCGSNRSCVNHGSKPARGRRRWRANESLRLLRPLPHQGAFVYRNPQTHRSGEKGWFFFDRRMSWSDFNDNAHRNKDRLGRFAFEVQARVPTGTAMTPNCDEHRTQRERANDRSD